MITKLYPPLLAVTLLSGLISNAAPDESETSNIKPKPTATAIPPNDCYRLKEVDVQPKVRKKAAPRYPMKLKQSGISGEALIECVVNTDGHPTAVRVIRATDPAFGKAGIDALSQWFWSPAMKSGRPVACRLAQPFEFKITKTDSPQLIEERNDETLPADSSQCYELKDVDTLPRPLKTVSPTYPLDLKREGISGDAVLEFIVDVDGNTTQVKIVHATAPAFGKAGVESLIQWRWAPSLKNGHRVPCRLQQPLTFELLDE